MSSNDDSSDDCNKYLAINIKIYYLVILIILLKNRMTVQIIKI